MIWLSLLVWFLFCVAPVLATWAGALLLTSWREDWLDVIVGSISLLVGMVSAAIIYSNAFMNFCK